MDGNNPTADSARHQELDAVVVGAGWAGMYMLVRLRKLGFRSRVFEAGSGVGGTWYWNRYPGARCDVPSLDYSYSFSEELEQEWEWTEHYAAQPEIERYANHVADRFDLRRDIQFDTRIISAVFDEESSRWDITTDRGDQVSARYCIMATGGYSAPIAPDIAGIDSFEGEMYFTATWPDEVVSFAHKRVGVIGTGSSGMQAITAIGASDPAHLYVFQRTANFAVPAQNRPMEAEYQRRFKETSAKHREQGRYSGGGVVYPVPYGPVLGLTDEEFERQMAERWAVGGPAVCNSVTDLLESEAANRRVADYLRTRVRQRVDDPAVAELLCAEDHFVGVRRILIESGYFETFNQPNVTLVDVHHLPISEITPTGLETSDARYELDAIVFATGFDSGTGAMLRIDFTGIGGVTLAEKWASGPRTYLGLMIDGLPNLFTIAGPGSPSIRSTVIVSIEQHVDWIADFLTYLEEHQVEQVEPTPDAEEAWTAHVDQLAASTLLVRNDTQYVGANVPGKPRAYLAYTGGVGPYRVICDDVRASGYEGFVMRTHGGILASGGQWSGPRSEVEAGGTYQGSSVL
jgi:cyclohexanone monooxygenase